MKQFLLIAVCVLALMALGFSSDPVLLRVATMTAMTVVLATSWNFIGGMTGYPSFAGAAFFGAGAYASAIIQATSPMVAAWIFGGCVTALLAAVLGAVLLHLRGHYFAIATLVVSEVLREIVNSQDRITGGGSGLSLPMDEFSIIGSARFYYLSMSALMVIAVVIQALIMRGKVGMALSCIRQNERAAEMLGINSARYKIAAFVMSAVFAGVAGGIYASLIKYIDPTDVFSISYSVIPIAIVLLGGAGTVLGPVIGSIAWVVLEEIVWRNTLSLRGLALGALIVVVVLFLPRGIISLWSARLFSTVRILFAEKRPA